MVKLKGKYPNNFSLPPKEGTRIYNFLDFLYDTKFISN